MCCGPEIAVVASSSSTQLIPCIKHGVYQLFMTLSLIPRLPDLSSEKGERDHTGYEVIT